MKHLWTSAFAALIIFSACQSGKNKTDETTQGDGTIDTIVAEQVADTTIYGKSDEFGMSTFTLVSDSGDTLYLTRTSEDGIDGKIYGDLNENQRYALTTRDNNRAIGVLINLTQLERHIKDYQICNGNLVIKGDTVVIEKLNDKEFKTK